jgi:hypothetical protein
MKELLSHHERFSDIKKIMILSIHVKNKFHIKTINGTWFRESWTLTWQAKSVERNEYGVIVLTDIEKEQLSQSNVTTSSSSRSNH